MLVELIKDVFGNKAGQLAMVTSKEPMVDLVLDGRYLVTVNTSGHGVHRTIMDLESIGFASEFLMVSGVISTIQIVVMADNHVQLVRTICSGHILLTRMVQVCISKFMKCQICLLNIIMEIIGLKWITAGLHTY